MATVWHRAVIAGLLLTPAALRSAYAQRVIFVKADAAGANDGSSWTDAFADLQDALAVALAGDEIWVAEGTYRPDRGTGDRMMAFELVCGVGLYGGFGGWEECREERDWNANETILSGDLLGDDGPRVCEQVSNCCYAHEGVGCDNAACQALVCSVLSPYDECCYADQPFIAWSQSCADSARYHCCDLGGWNVCENSFEIVRGNGCDGSTVVDGFIVQGAYQSNARDGYIEGVTPAGLRADGSNLLIGNCNFRENTNGIAAFETRMIINDSELSDNGSSGIYGTGEFELSGCSLGNNEAGGVHVYGDVILNRCAADGNGYGAVFVDSGRAEVNACSFSGNGWRGTIGVLDARSSLLTVSDCSFVGNPEESIQLWESALRVRNSRFERNTRVAAIRGWYSSAIVENSLFADNIGSGNIGLIYFIDGSVEVRNCTLARNVSHDGFPLSISVHNFESPASLVLSNSVFWGGDTFVPEHHRLLYAIGPASSIVVDHSIVQGWSGALGGEGNIGNDPMFVDPVGPDGTLGSGDEDYRLSLGSPAINAGDPDFIAQSGKADLDGHARVLCGQVDMGAYEFGIGDYDCNYRVDFADFASFPDCMQGPILPQNLVVPIDNPCTAFDFDGDGDIDLADFYGLQRVFAGP